MFLGVMYRVAAVAAAAVQNAAEIVNVALMLMYGTSICRC
jgi:hypothetical protein